MELEEREDSLDALYATFNKIKENQTSSKSLENPPLFDEILAAAATTNKDANAKRLAAQFICRLFPSLSGGQQKAAYNALIDLVEEDDLQTRKQVISGLPRLCRSEQDAAETGSHVVKVADLLVQLLQTDDEQELTMVQHSLLQVLNCNALAAVSGIFGQVSHDDASETVRLRALRFLAERLLSVARDQMTPRTEEAIVAHVDAALDDVSEEEFVCLVRVLASLQCMHTLSGRQRLVDMICGQMVGAADFDPSDPACVAKVRGCVRQAVPFLSRNIKAEQFVVYFLDRVMPVVHRVPEELPSEEVVADDRPRLDLLRRFAELCGHAGPNFSPSAGQMSSFLGCINALLPTPPEPTIDEVIVIDGDGDADTAESQQQRRRQRSHRNAGEENLNFSEAECLLVALHHLGRARPAHFEERPAELAALRKRLQYFQLANQSYQKSLQAALAESKRQQQPPSSTAAAAATAAAITVSNIGRLIRELFKSPPAFRPELASVGAGAAAASSSRPPPLPPSATSSLSSSRKRRAVDLPVYRPPAGKFSATAGRPSAAYGGRSRYYNVYTSSAGAGAGTAAGSSKLPRRSAGGGGGGGW